jgi:NMD protein affecting ribosome stability and mRNA decay
MRKCSKCGKDIEARRLTDGLCAMCLKVEAKTLVNVPVSNFLNAKALAQLSQK